MKSLQTLMQEQLPEGGVAIPGARDAHMEVIDITTGRVWMSVDAATQQDYEALLEGLDESLRGIGIGAAAHTGKNHLAIRCTNAQLPGAGNATRKRLTEL